MDDKLYNSLKRYFDKKVDTDITFDSLGIDGDAFSSEAKEIILQRVNDKASEWLERQED